MTDATKKKNIYEKNGNSNPNFEALLNNLNIYLATANMSLQKFSDRTGIQIETLRSIVYHKTNTCRIPTAIAIAKELGITLDELCASGLIPQEIMEEYKLIRGFTNTEKELLRWYIRKIHRRHQKFPGKKMVTIMHPACINGTLKSNNEYTAIDVDGFPINVQQTAFFGIVIPCEHHMPHYIKGQTILLSSDRNPRIDEHCVVNVDNDIYIVSYYEEEGKAKFKSIINKKPLPIKAEASDIVGYVSFVIEE